MQPRSDTALVDVGDQRRSPVGVLVFGAFFDETIICVHGYRLAKAVHQTQNVSEMIIISIIGDCVILLDVILLNGWWRR